MESISGALIFILENKKRFIITTLLILSMILVIFSGYKVKEMLYPSYSSCDKVKEVLYKKQNKNIPSFLYKHETEEYDHLCN